MVNALQIIKKEAKAKTVPENNFSVALNIAPKEIGPVARSQCSQQNICILYHKSKQLAYCSSECRHESQCRLDSALKISIGTARYDCANRWENLDCVSARICQLNTTRCAKNHPKHEKGNEPFQTLIKDQHRCLPKFGCPRQHQWQRWPDQHWIP